MQGTSLRGHRRTRSLDAASPLFFLLCFVFSLLLWLRPAAAAYTQEDVKRPAECATVTYPQVLPSLSVVITSLDEDPTVLENTVRSVLKYTPHHLLRDIVVVDDASKDQPVGRYLMHTYMKVHVVYNKVGRGVAGARMAGADASTGDVIVFLDSHMEVTERWAEPFLLHLQNHPDSIASAVIESIDRETHTYKSHFPRASLVTLRVRDLAFVWLGSPPARNISDKALATPSILGAAMGVDRKWWEQVGKYDPGLEVWGLENIEIAAKAWMCGSGAYLLPCSRIGHFYWKGNRTRGRYRYQENSGFIPRNKARFAQVWMDDQADRVLKQLARGNLTEHKLRRLPGLASRHELRQKLSCKSFQWYVDNVIYGIANMWKLPPQPETPKKKAETKPSPKMSATNTNTTKTATTTSKTVKLKTDKPPAAVKSTTKEINAADKPPAMKAAATSAPVEPRKDTKAQMAPLAPPIVVV